MFARSLGVHTGKVHKGKVHTGKVRTGKVRVKRCTGLNERGIHDLKLRVVWERVPRDVALFNGLFERLDLRRIGACEHIIEAQRISFNNTSKVLRFVWKNTPLI